MEIDEAFTPEVIDALDTNGDVEEEAELRELAKRIYTSNEINWSDEIISVSVLFFIAGRTYERGNQQKIQLPPVSPALAVEFMEFLAQKGSS